MSNIEKYIFRTNGGNTCDACGQYEGKEFHNPADIPNLPIHPNCCCWIEPIEDDECSYDDSIDKIDKTIGDGENLIDDIQSSISEFGDYLEEKYIDPISSEISGAINTLLQRLNATKYFVSNLIQLKTNAEGKTDKYYHAKANCEAAQVGEKAEETAKFLSDLKEEYDEECAKLKRKYEALKKSKWYKKICSSNGRDPEDEEANKYGRDKGRSNPEEDCDDLVSDVDKLFKK